MAPPMASHRFRFGRTALIVVVVIIKNLLNIRRSGRSATTDCAFSSSYRTILGNKSAEHLQKLCSLFAICQGIIMPNLVIPAYGKFSGCTRCQTTVQTFKF
jgi:dihydroorotase